MKILLKFLIVPLAFFAVSCGGGNKNFFMIDYNTIGHYEKGNIITIDLKTKKKNSVSIPALKEAEKVLGCYNDEVYAYKAKDKIIFYDNDLEEIIDEMTFTIPKDCKKIFLHVTTIAVLKEDSLEFFAFDRYDKKWESDERATTSLPKKRDDVFCIGLLVIGIANKNEITCIPMGKGNNHTETITLDKKYDAYLNLGTVFGGYIGCVDGNKVKFYDLSEKAFDSEMDIEF